MKYHAYTYIVQKALVVPVYPFRALFKWYLTTALIHHVIIPL